MLVAQAVTLLVFIAEPAEDVRPGKPDTHTLAAAPHRRTANVLGGRLARHIAHLFDADDCRHPVASRLDFCCRREQRDATGGTGCFVARGRDAGKRRMHRGEEPAEVSLAAKQLCREITHVCNIDRLRFDPNLFQGGIYGFGEYLEQVLAFARPVAREIRLVTAENINSWLHCVLSSQLDRPPGFTPSLIHGLRGKKRSGCSAR
jgi:hypothetical protein